MRTLQLKAITSRLDNLATTVNNLASALGARR